MKPLLIFLLAVSVAKAETDHGILCLALVAFSEARNQGDEGMAEVMRVVLNRASDSQNRWPKAICDVVNEPGQFAGVENWPYPRQPERIDAEKWQRVLELADLLIEGKAPRNPVCYGATHFDQGGNKEGLVKICQVGNHAFYIEKTITELVKK